MKAPEELAERWVNSAFGGCGRAILNIAKRGFHAGFEAGWRAAQAYEAEEERGKPAERAAPAPRAG